MKTKKNSIWILTSTVMMAVLLSFCTSGESTKSPEESTKNKITGETNKPKIAILGTFHFGHTGDVAAVKVDSILGDRRQREIDTLLEYVSKYEPNKILVERVPNRQAELDSLYNAYQAGKHELTVNEIQQLGFKLAKRRSLEKVYAIDHKLNLPFGELMEFAKENGMRDKMDSLVQMARNHTAWYSEYLKDKPLIDYYRMVNTDSANNYNLNFYLEKTLDFNADTQFPGAELTGQWYKRNLYIVAKMERVLEPGDRALLIVGNGHRPLLKHFLKTKTDVEYVEIHDFLTD